jgi:hypothetical protein
MDGNPLNEVRMLCDSILRNGGVLAADKTIKFNPAQSVLKLRVGDPITLTEAASPACRKLSSTRSKRGAPEGEVADGLISRKGTRFLANLQ